MTSFCFGGVLVYSRCHVRVHIERFRLYCIAKKCYTKFTICLSKFKICSSKLVYTNKIKTQLSFYFTTQNVSTNSLPECTLYPAVLVRHSFECIHFSHKLPGTFSTSFPQKCFAEPIMDIDCHYVYFGGAH